jgi:hypothetical protein
VNVRLRSMMRWVTGLLLVLHGLDGYRDRGFG